MARGASVGGWLRLGDGATGIYCQMPPFLLPHMSSLPLLEKLLLPAWVGSVSIGGLLVAIMPCIFTSKRVVAGTI